MVNKDKPKKIPEYMLPTITRRYFAVLLDGVFLSSVFMGLAYALQGNEGSAAQFRVGTIIALVLTYEPICTSQFCTIGQGLMKVRIRAAKNGNRISLVQAYSRILIKASLGWISFFTIPFSKGRRAIHDMGSGSIVVTVDALGQFGKLGTEPWPVIDASTNHHTEGLELDSENTIVKPNQRYSLANICIVCHKGIGVFSSPEEVTFTHKSFECIGNVHKGCLPVFRDEVEKGRSPDLFLNSFESQ